MTDGEVAQSVEQRTENPCVGGSIPFLATILNRCKLTACSGSFLALPGLWGDIRLTVCAAPP